MYNLYIKLDDAMMLLQKMMEDSSNPWKEWETIHKKQILEKALCEFPSLPTINLYVIDEMIEESKYHSDKMLLQELKQRLTK